MFTWMNIAPQSRTAVMQAAAMFTWMNIAPQSGAALQYVMQAAAMFCSLETSLIGNVPVEKNTYYSSILFFDKLAL